MSEKDLHHRPNELLRWALGLAKVEDLFPWLVAHAFGVRLLPRRVIYLVHRRATADQAMEEPVRPPSWVDGNHWPMGKQGLHRDRCLPVPTPRGHFIDNRRRLANQAAPGLIADTVDMNGSRLLFEGYGVSPKIRPYHAGPLGVYSQLVLDEAPLVPPLEDLLRDIATVPRLRGHDDQCRHLVPPVKVMALSATGRTRNGQVPSPTYQNLQHPAIPKRLRAKNCLSTRELNKNRSWRAPCKTRMFITRGVQANLYQTIHRIHERRMTHDVDY